MDEWPRADTNFDAGLGGFARRLLAVHFVAAAVAGHHHLSRTEVADAAKRRYAHGTPLQTLLLQAAALQLHASAAPVAAHALGLIPSHLAASCTPLPLAPSAGHAAAFAAAFLAANAAGGALALLQWRRRFRARAPPPPLRDADADADVSLVFSPISAGVVAAETRRFPVRRTRSR